jgi:hypothetical protein
MRFLFTDDAFSFEALRVTGYACYGGADLGEVLVGCRISGWRSLRGRRARLREPRGSVSCR